MSIINANPCRQRGPTLYTLQTIADLDWIKTPNEGDLAGLVVPGATEWWVFLTPSIEEANGYDVIDGGCQGAWYRGSTSTYNVMAFGAVGDGETDDTVAIQTAIRFAVVAGGEVYFPARPFLITDELLVQSLYPVHLVGRMNGYGRNGLTPKCAGLIIGANISGSMVRYATPTGSTRDEAGGGSVSGLAFRDETGTNSTPGNYTCTAALELEDFNLSVVRDCNFQFIKGSAIKTDFTVQTSVECCSIRYCGAIGKPAFWITQTDATYTTQSFVVDDVKMEVCHAEPYITVDAGANLSEIKIRDCGFEADPVLIPDSSQNFISVANAFTTISGCHFNRTLEIQVVLEASAQLVIVSDCQFRGPVNAIPAIEMAGIDCECSTSYFNSGKSGDEILISGTRNMVLGNLLVTSGGIRGTGIGNTVALNHMVGSTTTNAYWIDAGVGGINLGNYLQNDNTGVSGGIIGHSAPTVIVGNLVRQMAAAGIRAETINTVVVGNSSVDNVGLPLSTSDLPEPVGLNELYPTPYLQNSVVFDPGSIAAGATLETTVAVTDARIGDFAQASISTLLAGIRVLADVTGVDIVTVTFWNTTGAPIDMDSGTVRAVVTKGYAQ